MGSLAPWGLATLRVLRPDRASARALHSCMRQAAQMLVQFPGFGSRICYKLEGSLGAVIAHHRSWFEVNKSMLNQLNKALYRRHAVSIVSLVVLIVGGALYLDSRRIGWKLPPLPDISLENVEPAVRVQIEAVHRSAIENLGPCCMLTSILHPPRYATNGRSCSIAAPSIGPTYRHAHTPDWVSGTRRCEQRSRANPTCCRPGCCWRSCSGTQASSRPVGSTLKPRFDRIRNRPPPTMATAGCSFFRGANAEALQELKRAVELWETYGAAHYTLALAYRKNGDHELAERHMHLFRRYRGSRGPTGIRSFARRDARPQPRRETLRQRRGATLSSRTEP